MRNCSTLVKATKASFIAPPPRPTQLLKISTPLEERTLFPFFDGTLVRDQHGGRGGEQNAADRVTAENRRSGPARRPDPRPEHGPGLEERPHCQAGDGLGIEERPHCQAGRRFGLEERADCSAPGRAGAVPGGHEAHRRADVEADASVARRRRQLFAEQLVVRLVVFGRRGRRHEVDRRGRPGEMQAARDLRRAAVRRADTESESEEDAEDTRVSEFSYLHIQ